MTNTMYFVSEWHDCGAWARFRGLPISDCPNHKDPEDSEQWKQGWNDYGKMHSGQVAMMELRKTGATK